MLGCATWFRMVVMVASLMLGMASAEASDSKSIERAAHDAYVSAINSNDVDALHTDTGEGINILRRGSDGRWRVAIDGWSSDRPAGH